MTEFIFVALLTLLVLLPFVLLVLGIIRLHKNNGFILFLIGGGLISLFIIGYASEYIAIAICKVLYFFGITASFHDTSIITIPLFILSLYLLYKLFIYLYNLRSAKFVAYAKPLIQRAQNPSLPSCEGLIINQLREIVNSQPKVIPANQKRAAEIEVYKIALSKANSSNYRDLFGELTTESAQLIQICHYCLDHFLEEGYITEKEYEENCSILENSKRSLYTQV